MTAPATTMTTPDGLVFEPPPGFRREASTVILRIAAEHGVAEPGLRAPLRPNLVVERRLAPPGAGLAHCVAGIQEGLVRGVPGLRGIDALDVCFADGAIGVVLAYSFPAPRVPDVVLCQLQAVRLDRPTLTTLTFTATLAYLTEARRDQLLQFLASARLVVPEGEAAAASAGPSGGS